MTNEVTEICKTMLEQGGFSFEYGDLQSNHEEAYLFLRDALYKFDEEAENEGKITAVLRPLDPERWMRENQPDESVYAFIEEEFARKRKDEQLEMTEGESDNDEEDSGENRNEDEERFENNYLGNIG